MINISLSMFIEVNHPTNIAHMARESSAPVLNYVPYPLQFLMFGKNMRR